MTAQSTPSEKIYLALDFDGVIADSIRECLICGYNAYHQISGTGKRTLSRNHFSDDVWNLMRNLRAYIRSGEDFVYISHIIDTRVTIRSQGDFDNFIERHLSSRERYYAAFYEERSWLYTHNRDEWFALNPLYPGVAEFLRNEPPDTEFIIITTKKPFFVQEILRYNGIRMDEKMIYHASSTHPKRKIVAELLHRFGISPHRFHFVDDHPHTVSDVAKTGVKVYLASWGYNTVEQRDELTRENIHVIGPDELFSMK